MYKIEHSGNVVYAIHAEGGVAVYPTLALLAEHVKAGAVRVNAADLRYYRTREWLPVTDADLEAAGLVDDGTRTVNLRVDTTKAMMPNGGVTPAPAGLKPGPMRAGQFIRIIAITGVPEGVTDLEVARLYSMTADATYLGHDAEYPRHVYTYDELGIGKIIRE